jgi:hypothetical protein
MEMMMNLSDVETGCYIDGSHMSSFDFSAAVIEFAHDYGFELDWDVFLVDTEQFRAGEISDEFIPEVLNALDWTYDDAIEYLNDNTRQGLCWVIRDQSLFLMTEEDAEC